MEGYIIKNIKDQINAALQVTFIKGTNVEALKHPYCVSAESAFILPFVVSAVCFYNQITYVVTVHIRVKTFLTRNYESRVLVFLPCILFE